MNYKPKNAKRDIRNRGPIQVFPSLLFEFLASKQLQILTGIILPTKSENSITTRSVAQKSQINKTKTIKTKTIRTSAT